MRKTNFMVGIWMALAVAAQAAVVTFTGSSNAAWSVNGNWSDNAVPDGADTAQINSGSTVNFDYGSGWPAANAIAVNVDGRVNAGNAVRSWVTVWNIGSTGMLDIGSNWLVPWGGGAAFYFDSGATLNMSGNIQFGGAGADTTLGFNLASDGFETLSAGGLFFGNGGAEYDNQTIKVDMNDYTGGAGTIVLMNLASGNGMTDAIFQGLNLSVVNDTGYEGSALQWNETTSDIELVIPAGPFEWDGDGSDGNWNTPTNWNQNQVPGSSDDVIIGSSYTVTNAQSEFATLSIGAGSMVTFGEELSGGVVTNAGTMDYSGVFRLNGARVHLTGTGSLGSNISFLDLTGGDLSFEDGASFANSGMSLEHKGVNRFDFKLSASGFTALTAGSLVLSSDISNATYVVDMADFTAPAANIALVDFSNGGTLTESQFQAATLIVTNDSGYGASLVWDNANDVIKLDMGAIDYDVTWDGGAGDGLWSNATNWTGDALPADYDVIGIHGATVDATAQQWLPGHSAIHLTGASTLTGGLVRASASTIYVGSQAALTGGTWDLDDASFVFEDGAAATMTTWEQKDLNTFTFYLSTSGFTTLTPGNLGLGTGSLPASISNATYIVDMADFTGPAQNISLVDFSNGGSLSNSQFQTATLIVTNDSGFGASLVWDDANDVIKLDMGAIDYDVTWDGGGADSDWMTAANWNPDTVPGGSDAVLVGSGAVVTNAQATFASLNVGAGALVAFASQFLDSGNQIISDGQIEFPGTARLNGATVTLDSTGSLSANVSWLDLLNGTINFVDGAAFGNSSISVEHKGINTIGFTLSETGFTTLQAGALHAGNNAAWSNATYNIDISEYNYSNGLSFVLADYTSVFPGTFNPTINIIPGSSGLGAALSLDAALARLVLTIDPPGNDAPVAADQTVSVPTNGPVAFTLVATDIEGSNLTYTVESLPSYGTLSGTAPNLTYTPTDGAFTFDTFTFTAFDGEEVSNTGTVTMARIPYTDDELWTTYHDAILTDPLNTEWLTNWVDNGISIWQVRYGLGDWVGTRTNASPKIAAFYAYPVGGTNLPGLVQIHGGGQRGMWQMAKLWAEQGYAAISINWGALPLLDGQPNTDWDGLPSGFTREGVTGAIFHNWCDPDVYDDGATLYDVPHPLNSSWIHNAYAGRRALTFLTDQSIVDTNKLGVVGWSMGGNTTSKVATDPRLTAVGPGVGGTGYLYEDWWGLPGTARSTNGVEAFDLHIRTVDSQSYWPDVTAPTLYLEAANDFNAPFDLVIKALSLQDSNVPQRLAVSLHFNHRNWPDAEVSRVLWMKTHLTGTFDFPETSPAELDLSNPDGVPRFRVWPDTSTTNPIVSVDIYYGIERDSRIRFWRDTVAVETNGYWEAECPIYDLDEMMAAMAIIKYDAGFETPLFSGQSSIFSIASDVHLVYPPELENNGIKETAEKMRLVDDFALDYKDWWYLNPDNTQHWQFWTRKLGDPSWRGPIGGELALDVATTASGNTLGVHLDTEQWNTTDATSFKATVAVPANGANSVSLPVTAFTNGYGEALTSWDDVKHLGLQPGYMIDGGLPAWSGDVPVFSNLRWESGIWIFTNGVTSTWLESYGLGLNDLTVLSDTDIDGLLTWEEEFAGTDPTNSASVLRINDVSAVDSDRIINWQAVEGKNYTIWFKTNLTDTAWVEQATGIPGVEPSCTHTVAVDSATGFVRIEVE